MKKKQATVFVGISGGVDSSVAAARLLDQGYDVVGVFIKVWHPDWLPCAWEEERRYAMKVAAHLDIPFLTCDAKQEYYDDVAKYFVSEYAAGRTPNPDVMCNKYVKFGSFLRFAKAKSADYIATGHYAQKKPVNQNESGLFRGLDKDKDQSYFLWTLTQQQLVEVLFPIGDTEKQQIRREAQDRSLPTAEKKDSQGICFLGQVDIYDFLKNFITLIPGKVLNTAGQVVGKHKSSYIYTLGQRHGFVIDTGLHTMPHYIVSIDHQNNTITVDTKPPKATQSEKIQLQGCNWINQPPEKGSQMSAQVRYRQTPVSVVLHSITDNTAEIELKNKVLLPASGQSCVLYDSNRCLGGGIIV